MKGRAIVPNLDSPYVVIILHDREGVDGTFTSIVSTQIARPFDSLTFNVSFALSAGRR